MLLFSLLFTIVMVLSDRALYAHRGHFVFSLLTCRSPGGRTLPPSLSLPCYHFPTLCCCYWCWCTASPCPARWLKIEFPTRTSSVCVCVSFNLLCCFSSHLHTLPFACKPKQTPECVPAVCLDEISPTAFPQANPLTCVCVCARRAHLPRPDRCSLWAGGTWAATGN